MRRYTRKSRLVFNTSLREKGILSLKSPDFKTCHQTVHVLTERHKKTNDTDEVQAEVERTPREDRDFLRQVTPNRVRSVKTLATRYIMIFVKMISKETAQRSRDTKKYLK